jgi:hypothetical protein
MRPRRAGLVAALPLLGFLSGCGASHARYTPTALEARSALDKALTAWRDGKKVGDVDAKPPVHVVDSAWRGGQQIDAFQIGEEEDVGDGTKQFVVKLTVRKAKESQDVRYVVNGRDPVWVYREEDYKRMLNMENNPVTPSNARPTRPKFGKSR